MHATKETPAQAARRGDVIGLEATHHDYDLDKGMQTRTVYSLGIVTSVTREGLVKAYADVRAPQGTSWAIGQYVKGYSAITNWWVVPATELDMNTFRAVLSTHEGTFPTLEDMVAFARQFKVGPELHPPAVEGE